MGFLSLRNQLESPQSADTSTMNASERVLIQRGTLPGRRFDSARFVGRGLALCYRNPPPGATSNSRS